MNPDLKRKFRRILPTLLLTIALLGVVGCWGASHFGSVSAALAYARGERLLVPRPDMSFGVLAIDKHRTLSYTLINRADRPSSFLAFRRAAPAYWPTTFP